ncbi:hypothetical protein K8Z61_16165 [Nocardioides sp. TRM66260-LWL]|uniref:hypothetical protein n=1 Tax=Nocardioides sp. TRM66260-LWL TaxID=2874478 RepID=UPI001CC7C855|nr:hypothetical protein [Nocardioides sp. TRM66260-LWL]MBZ5736030.1 hypothetical protein [Nocardioides sp. TRM66260-LWL]
MEHGSRGTGDARPGRGDLPGRPEHLDHLTRPVLPPRAIHPAGLDDVRPRLPRLVWLIPAFALGAALAVVGIALSEERPQDRLPQRIGPSPTAPVQPVEPIIPPDPYAPGGAP